MTADNHDKATGAPAAERPFGLDLSMAVFDRATRLARSLFEAADSLVILMENGVAWRSRFRELDLGPEDSGAEIALASGGLLWVDDAACDPRFSGHPFVVGPPYLRAYIAAPIRLQD